MLRYEASETVPASSHGLVKSSVTYAPDLGELILYVAIL